jgi:hypothetical protein
LPGRPWLTAWTAPPPRRGRSPHKRAEPRPLHDAACMPCLRAARSPPPPLDQTAAPPDQTDPPALTCKIRPHPSVSIDGEHVPAIPSIYSLRFVSYPSPSSPVALLIRCLKSTIVLARSSRPSQAGG